ncbi:uncharacterized protein LOC134752673 [Cydia strobilella]|uniref:uncharacterized protein LOC134752673 n=1 Tax=Cydia strobilella TaxID=1100964 RepID=UPI003006B6F9
MFRRKIFSIFLNAVIIQNSVSQILPISSGCGCQQMPGQQNLPVPVQVSNNCGCRNNLLNLPNGIQINNNLQLAKNPCIANNIQLANMQNLLAISNGLQVANGLQLANPLSQELLALLNNVPVSNCQNMLQVSLQALLNQLGQQPNCQCGCQSLASNIGNSLINGNLNVLGVNGMQKAISNLPCQSVANLQVVSGQQEVVLNGNPYQSCQNIVSNPCQNVINPCACQNVVSSPCACQNIISSPCQASQNVIGNPCPCQSCQSPMQFTIYQ